MAEVLVQVGPLREFIHRVALAVGADEAAASEVAHHLVRANLSGHDSHGVLRMPWYNQVIKSGQMQPSVQPKILRERGATVLIDAGASFGQYSTIFGLEWAIKAAREYGIATAAIRHSSHIGRLGEYAERATAAGMVGIATYGVAGPGTGIVVPFGGRERFLGTNPWAFGVPTTEDDPMLYDAATSTIAEGKIRVARAKGGQLPPGCIIDNDGLPSTTPDDFYDGGALLPLGGATGGHKGYGLAMSAALIGGLAMIDDDIQCSWDVGARLGRGDDEASGPRGHITGVVLIVIDPSFFGDTDQYRALTGATVAAVRGVQPAEGTERVLSPGEPESQTRARRERDGIPLAESTWEELTALGREYNIPMPDVKR